MISKKLVCITLCLFALQTQTTITPICTDTAAKPVGPFSQAMKVSNPQEMLFISGQLPINPETDEVEIKDIALATKQCMENLLAILKAAGMDFSHVFHTNIRLTDINDFAVVNTVYASFLTAPYPARFTYQVAALPKGACIEIDMTAAK